MLGLYVHIPFCHSLCHYCDFPKFINQKEDVIDKYLDKLIFDINELKEKNLIFDTLYIGGGTPNYLSDNNLNRLFYNLNQLNFKFNAEKSIEANVDFINEEQIKILSKYGINRVSIGVETFDSKIGKIINRYTDYDELKAKISLLHQYHIDNINLDFIYALPKQNLKSFKNDLKLALKLKPKHLSFYQLILEDNSVLYKNHINDFPNEDIVLKMDKCLNKKLKKYHHYEISNYAIKGYESKHNLLYWNMDEYIGLGLSASSLYQNKRITNSKIMSKYLAGLDVDVVDSEMGEFFWLGLRKLDGVNLNEFRTKYQKDPFDLYDIYDLLNKKLVSLDDNNQLKLTEKGLEVANIVFAYFV